VPIGGPIELADFSRDVQLRCRLVALSTSGMREENGAAFEDDLVSWYEALSPRRHHFACHYVVIKGLLNNIDSQLTLVESCERGNHALSCSVILIALIPITRFSFPVQKDTPIRLERV
jgi:hypothetical protein